MADKPAWGSGEAVARAKDFTRRDQEFARQLRSFFTLPEGEVTVRFIEDMVFPIYREEEPPPRADWRDLPAVDYCWICGGPCLVLAWMRQNQRSPYDNGNVIEGEVVHSRVVKELM